ncbi:MAG: GIY-YIG nuclease family protein [Candidatus Omnitrophica bacterium]|nr:GIY-YIG nuclease family protein [Candidatus Omnitrophota bacterium]
MYYVYAMISDNKNRIYVGMTTDISKRVNEHNAGKTKSTKFHRPWKVFYFEKFEERISARFREKQLKAGCGKEFLREILKHNAPVAHSDRATAF